MHSSMNIMFPIISIHAPREGGDESFITSKNSTHAISIHAPREGGDRIHQKV